VFVRTSSLIEGNLEEMVEGLQVDNYLGDADWRLVWRWVVWWWW